MKKSGKKLMKTKKVSRIAEKPTIGTREKCWQIVPADHLRVDRSKSHKESQRMVFWGFQQ